MTTGRKDMLAEPTRPLEDLEENRGGRSLETGALGSHLATVTSVTWTPAPATIAHQLVVALTASEVESTIEVSSDCDASCDLLPGVDRRAG